MAELIRQLLGGEPQLHELITGFLIAAPAQFRLGKRLLQSFLKLGA